MHNGKCYISKEKKAALEEELQYLQTTGRKELSEKLEEAIAMGDLSENAAYHDAKEKQAFMEGRILEIKEILNNAIIIPDNTQSDIVEIGSNIVVKIDSKEKQFKIVGTNEADPLLGKISNESPLGHAFLGKKVGDEVEVEVPAGKIKYKIIKIF
jgi:transcription elongation factor GreA